MEVDGGCAVVDPERSPAIHLAESAVRVEYDVRGGGDEGLE